MAVTQGDVYEVAVLIKTTFQHDRVPVRIPPQKFSERLKAQHAGTLHHSFCSGVEIFLDNSEDKPAHLREKPFVVSEEYSQALWHGPGQESVGTRRRRSFSMYSAKSSVRFWEQGGQR